LIVAKVRVVETVRGDASRTRQVRFTNDWCGGVRLDLGGYYALAVDDAVRTIDIREKTPLLDLFMNYAEVGPTRLKISPIVQKIRDAVQGSGRFEDIPDRESCRLNPFATC
jgi:hypothetical protein